MKPRPVKMLYEGISAFDLDKKEFAPIKWIIPQLVCEGCTIVSGRPKAGKSWLMLNTAIAVLVVV